MHYQSRSGSTTVFSAESLLQQLNTTEKTTWKIKRTRKLNKEKKMSSWLKLDTELLKTYVFTHLAKAKAGLK